MARSVTRLSSAARRPLATTAGLALAAVALTACGTGVSAPAESSGSASGEAVSIRTCGRELSFPDTPQAVVGLMPSQTELLLRLGAGDALVGQAQTATSALPNDVADQVEDVPVVSEDTPPAREDLLAVGPDLVVSPTEYEFTPEQGYASIEQLEDSGAAAYVAAGGCADRRNTAEVTDLLTDIDNLGVVLRAEDEAGRLRADVERRLAAVEEAVPAEDRLSVAQVYVEGSTLGVIGAGVEADIIRRAGGENVFDPDAPEFAEFFAAEVNPEEIVERDPDAIVFGVADDADEQRIRDYLHATFPDVTAVREDRLIAVPQADLYPGALGGVDAVEHIAQELYPDAF